MDRPCRASARSIIRSTGPSIGPSPRLCLVCGRCGGGGGGEEILQQAGIPIFFYGHIHQQRVWQCSPVGDIEERPAHSFTLQPNHWYMVSIGNVSDFTPFQPATLPRCHPLISSAAGQPVPYRLLPIRGTFYGQSLKQLLVPLGGIQGEIFTKEKKLI